MKNKSSKKNIKRKDYPSEELYQRALRLEKMLDEMEIKVNIKKRTCFECKRIVKEADLSLYPHLDNKWVNVCSRCRKKFSNFGVKQINASKKYLNWYEAEYQESLLPVFPKKKFPLPKIKSMYWLIDTSIGEYLGDENNNKILNIVMEDGKIYRGKYIGNNN